MNVTEQFLTIYWLKYSHTCNILLRLQCNFVKTKAVKVCSKNLWIKFWNHWNFSHSDSLLKLWLSRAWFLGLCDQNLLECQIPTDWKDRGFLPRIPTTPKISVVKLCILAINYEYVNISSFAVLGIKLWLEEDGDLNRNDLLYSFKFHSVESSKLIQNVIIF